MTTALLALSPLGHLDYPREANVHYGSMPRGCPPAENDRNESSRLTSLLPCISSPFTQHTIHLLSGNLLDHY
jgi:hypothetical protein